MNKLHRNIKFTKTKIKSSELLFDQDNKKRDAHSCLFFPCPSQFNNMPSSLIPSKLYRNLVPVEITAIINQIQSHQVNNMKDICDHLSLSLLIKSNTRTSIKMVKITDLPTDMIVEIFGFLDQDTLMEISLVSKKVHNIAKNKKMITPVFEI